MIKATKVGFLTGVHGVAGHLKLSTEVPLDNLKKGTWCFVEIQKKPVPFFIEETMGNDTNWVLKLKGIDTPEQAKTFQGKGLLLAQENLPKKRAFMGEELMHLKVFAHPENTLIGEVTDVYNNSGQLIIVVTGAREHLIPLHEDFVVSIDDIAAELYLDLPEGLLDL